jgi:hypothetical protein
MVLAYLFFRFMLHYNLLLPSPPELTFEPFEFAVIFLYLLAGPYYTHKKHKEILETAAKTDPLFTDTSHFS